jgi:hypothetical protein
VKVIAMTDQETEIWLEALAGRAAADDRRAPVLEAQVLRDTLLRMPQPDAPLEPSQDRNREAALLELARREGLLVDRINDRGWRSRLGVFAAWPALGALTALACSAIVIAILVRPSRAPETVRGAPEELVVLTDAHPARLRSELLTELEAAGVKATAYERLGREGIDADLPQPIPERVRTVLSRHHIEIPRDGVLRIEIAPAEPP